jgi:hypothetical protein
MISSEIMITSPYEKFYDCNYTQVRLFEERFEVDWYDGHEWKDTGITDSSNPNRVQQMSYIQNVSGVFITRTQTDSSVGVFNVTYVFRTGSPLKHIVVFKNIQNIDTFRVIQIWNGIVGSKVNSEIGEYAINGTTSISSSWFQFKKPDGSLTVLIDQRDMVYNVTRTRLQNKCLQQPVTIDTDPNGMKGKFIYANWTLAKNQQLDFNLSSSTIQPSVIDARLLQTNPNGNYGSTQWMSVVSNQSNNKRAIVYFSLASVPAGATITLANLSLYYYSDEIQNPVGRTYKAYRVTGHNWTESGVCWNKYDLTHSWTTAGGDYSTIAGGSAIVPANIGWMTWTVTGIVQSWKNGTNSNHGFLIRDNSEDASGLGYECDFRTKDYTGDITKRPKLYVEYTTNWPPKISRLTIVVSEANITTVNCLTELNFTVECRDLDQLKDLVNVTITLWSSAGSEGQYSTQNGYRFQWYNSSGTWTVTERNPDATNHAHLNVTRSTKPSAWTSTTWQNFTFSVWLSGDVNPTSWSWKAYVIDSKSAQATKQNSFNVNQPLSYMVSSAFFYIAVPLVLAVILILVARKLRRRNRMRK